MRQFRYLAVLVLSLSLLSVRAEAMMVIPLNLEGLTQMADRIFLGTVVSVDNRFDGEGRWCQLITFDVQESFKGDLGTTVTIKQVNLNPLELSDGTVILSTVFRGVPQFEEGETVLVFLNGDSSIGFTTAVGLGQGAFRVKQNAFGHQMLVNDFNNAGLFKGMSVRPSFKAQGINEARMQALQSSPNKLYLDQMRTLLQGLTSSESNSK